MAHKRFNKRITLKLLTYNVMAVVYAFLVCRFIDKLSQMIYNVTLADTVGFFSQNVFPKTPQICLEMT